ncbi:mitochondrial ribosomal protein MRP51 [Thelonectria olida]|uniref:Mitochondrial ribosomal protein MRP51 n=1 Tax=Thelonectria olida TaxID=1576542 RepID=A0A9P9AR53_9HYPO|nr:mitochondrial ribosomal protein MRP51 [Thelonectria olida]
MGASNMSPGGALLKSSRLFSVPKPLPEPPSIGLLLSSHVSPTMTRHYPQHQSITSPLSSREKGDWGLKRGLPLKTTMTTSTPLVRVKQIDSIESVTDFASAADHTLSLEKFQELRVAVSIPKPKDRGQLYQQTNQPPKSVFEEDTDFTETRDGKADVKRWKFKGPWLARLSEGVFLEYLKKQVRPRRAEFREVLKEKLAADKSARLAAEAKEKGLEPPAAIQPQELGEEELSEYVRYLRHDRATLYALVSKFLDLAPLGQPVGILSTFLSTPENSAEESPYGKTGPPPSHPSAGISYLRTSSFMENHPVYGPQERHTPVMSRVLHPRQGLAPAKLGVAGFVAETPDGDNEFNTRPNRRVNYHKRMLTGITHLDTTTFGGAKAFVDPNTASIDPSGKVILRLRASSPESQLIAKESQGREKVYIDKPAEAPKKEQRSGAGADAWRMDSVADEVLGDIPRSPNY